MDNYIAYALILTVGTGVIYFNRWSLLGKVAPLIDKSLDRFFEFKRSISQREQIYLDNHQLIVTEIAVRQYDDMDTMVFVDKQLYVVDVHLGSNGAISLKDLSIQICTEGFYLVDIYYHFRGHKFVFTQPARPIIFLYRPDVKNACFGVSFESVSIKSKSGEVITLSDTLQSCLADQLNRYLGPLDDFHYGLNPIKAEWMDLKNLPFNKGDKLILTTQLMETVEIEWGSTLQNCL